MPHSLLDGLRLGPMMRRRTFVLSSIAGLIGTGILANSRIAAAGTAYNSILKVGMARDIGSFDPAFAVTSTVISANLLLFERLYETSFADRKTRAQLAVGDPVKITNTLYRVKFKTGGKFHNGDPVTVDDVVFSINRVVDDEVKSFYRQFLPFVKGARAAGTDVVEIELNYPTDLLKDRLAVIAIAPLSLTKGDLEAFGANPIGSGPYRLVSSTANDKVVLERFADYNGDTPGLVQTVELRIITDPAARISAINVGDVSIIEEPSDLDLDTLRSNTELSVELRSGFLASFLMFNCSKPPFNDKRVRQALMYAIDKQELVNVGLYGYGREALSLLPEIHPLYREPRQKYGYDPEKARALLAAAGYPNGLKIDGRRFVCQTYQTVWNEAAANLIVAKWRDVGFEVEQNVGGEAIYSGIVNGTYDLAIAITDQSWFGWDGPLLYEWFHGAFWSKQLNGFKTEAAAHIQDLLRECLQEGADQAQLLENVQSIILDEMPISLLFHRDVPTAWRQQDIGGVLPIETAGLDLRTVSIGKS